MTDREAAVHAANEAKYCPLPEPVRFRKGPVNEEGQPLDPARRIIAVYPDGTFPLKKDE